MLKTRMVWLSLALMGFVLLAPACGPSEEMLRARDQARADALAAEERADAIEAEYYELLELIPELQAQIAELHAELAELQAEYESLGGGSR
jgi:septal ring factor EnvC (AmiA/AmiB activator)